MTASNTRPRRRAYRAPGPAGATAADIVVRSDSASKPEAPAAASPTRPPAGPLGPPPRRPAHTRLVALLALGVGALVVAVVIGVVTVLSVQQSQVRAELDHRQRFVDTATQMVVNMFSFTQDTVEDSVNRFVNSTSGPLRDMLMHNNNTENLKAMFRDTNASSEAVVNGAALESHDPVGRKAAVLVSVRVTVTDIDGVNKPSQPYRMRVIVSEDDNGHMTGYDLMYPDGGN
ncbi:mammalian cell entry protein [Mycolicibacterium thermoresistibile]